MDRKEDEVKKLKDTHPDIRGKGLMKVKERQRRGDYQRCISLY